MKVSSLVSLPVLVLIIAAMAGHILAQDAKPKAGPATPQASASSVVPALPPPLARELAEYKAKREEGVKRLDEAAMAQLKTLQEEQMKAGNLDGANALAKAMAALPIISPDNVTPPGGLPAQAVAVLKDHTAKVLAGISGLNRLFIPRIDKVTADLLKAGDLAGANAARARSRELQEEADKLALEKLARTEPGGKGKEEVIGSFTVEALIDGGSELHVTKEGLYWVVTNTAAKPGLHGGSKEATYINGARWKPEWRQKGERGPDTSEAFAQKTTSPKLVCETVLVSKERFGKDLGAQTPVQTRVKDDHFIVSFPDPETGSRWYKVRIKTVP